MAEETTDFSNRITKLAKGTALSAFPFNKYPDNKAAEYRIDYPKLTEYLENQLPKLAKNETIVNSFKQYTNMTVSQIETLLKWVDGPELVIKQIYTSPTSGNNILGKFDKTQPDKLFLDIDFVNQMENATSGSSLCESLIFYIRVIILREAVHYGDFNYNNDYYTGNNPLVDEEGRLM